MREATGLAKEVYRKDVARLDGVKNFLFVDTEDAERADKYATLALLRTEDRHVSQLRTKANRCPRVIPPNYHG